MITDFKIDDEHLVKFNEETKKYDYYKNGALVPTFKDKLYRFFKFNTENADALLNFYFHLSNPKFFNDPFDCNTKLIVDFDDNEKDVFYEKIGIVSFCEDINHPIMWAHYADNYRGFAIEYDMIKFDYAPDENQIESIELRKVNYLNYIVNIQKAFNFSHDFMVLSKGKYWEYEKEWRLIVKLGQNNHRVLKFNPEMVKAIYIGFNMFDKNITETKFLISIIKISYPNTKVYIVRPHPQMLTLGHSEFKI